MKKITFLTFLLIGLICNAQTLPLDFEVPEDDSFSAFNGATATVVTDPTDATNQVLELTSNGADFDGAAINLATYVDLSDDNNNTITMEFWTPDATTRTHLLKFEGATNGPPATELYFDTTMAGWQTVSVDFGPGLADDYPVMVLFADSGVGNTATGTYYIDDIDGPNGEDISPDPQPSDAAPVPTYADSEVYSIYNDTNAYTTTFPVIYDFGTATTVDLDPTATVNNALKLNFGVAGYGQGEGGPDDVSAYDFLTFDYWAGPSSGASGWNVVLIDNDGVVSEFTYQYTAPQETIIEESWQTAIIPMSTFTDLGFDPTNLFQWKFDPLGQDVNNAQVVYFDNLAFITQEALGVEDLAQVNFQVYPNPTKDSWSITSNNTIKNISVYNVLGKQVMSISVNDLQSEINATELNIGLYLVQINTDAGSETIKLIKN